ncbi:MAG: ribose-phosphate diphosphokinase [Candidatus Magasanikbacteria bacterium]|nr:ribose-phosphate diphosphokinase [Candidatus Magasanikbacteria bacterium]
MDNDLIIFSGSSHEKFAEAVAAKLFKKLGERTTTKFSNENIMIQVRENVREKDVFVIQTSCPPVHENFMELLIFIDALKHASASRITAVLPYMPYVRSDKKDQPRISITARLVADLLETAGADRVLTMDLHSHQVQGFFRIPVDQLRAVNTLCEKLRQLDLNQDNAVLIAADAGEAKHIGAFANRLDLPFAIIDKRRTGNDEKPKAVGIVGDVKDKICAIIDDEIASGGTLIQATNFLLNQGANKVMAAVTHGVFSGSACGRIKESAISKVIATDTIPACNPLPDKIEYITVTDLFAEAIKRIHTGESISHIFQRGWDTR